MVELGGITFRVRNSLATHLRADAVHSPLIEELIRNRAAHCALLVQFPWPFRPHLMHWRSSMNGIIYLVGLVVVVMAVLSLIGIR